MKALDWTMDVLSKLLLALCVIVLVAIVGGILVMLHWAVIDPNQLGSGRWFFLPLVAICDLALVMTGLTILKNWLEERSR